jgi:acetate kinase
LGQVPFILNSAASSRVTVRIIHTDEELMIARSVYRVFGLGMTRPPVGP